MVRACRCNYSSMGQHAVISQARVCNAGSMVICTYGSWKHRVLGIAWTVSGLCVHQEASHHASPAC